MYELFFALREKPFSLLPDPKFLYFGREHSMAYGMLEYGVVSQAGFTVITGAVGSGKTTLIRHLLATVGHQMHIGLISHTALQGGNLLEWILMAFDQPFEGSSYPGLYKRFRDFVELSRNSQTRLVLIIDEAQNIPYDRLEELRMLSNLNTDTMLFQLILVGQPELRTALQAPSMTQFAQRVSSDFHLPRLLPREASEYIDHRVRVAGGQRGLFSSSAKKLIAEAAQGIPRQINVLADRCLVYAYAKSAGTVSSRIVRKAIEDRERHGIFSAQPAMAYT